jgi:hypothetical protein
VRAGSDFGRTPGTAGAALISDPHVHGEARSRAPAEVRAGAAALVPRRAARVAAAGTLESDPSHRRSGLSMPGRTARTLNLILGAWLFVSAFLWSHTPADRVNDWAVGLAIVVFAVLAMSIPAVRWVNTALGAWLFISAFALPHAHAGTRWNEVLVGLFVFFISIVPTEIEAGRVENPARA